MNKSDVIAFFDRCAPTWDAEMIRSDEIIGEILDRGGIRPGADVLDVACGTGVLFPDYLARSIGSLTAIDISPEMVRIAREKFPEVTVLCGDAETAEFDRSFDAVMIYNAFPHFPDPAALFAGLSRWLAPGGRLTVAHGMSRAAIDRHHSGSASRVSCGLLHEDALAAVMAPYLDVDVKISDEEKYIVSGTRKA